MVIGSFSFAVNIFVSIELVVNDKVSEGKTCAFSLDRTFKEAALRTLRGFKAESRGRNVLTVMVSVTYLGVLFLAENKHALKFTKYI